MSALARLARMPDWPARMTADVAACYMGIAKSTFLSRYGESGIREGSNVLWARRQLDAVIAKQFDLPHLAGQPAPEIDTWGDLQ